jgi:hypothetical protein
MAKDTRLHLVAYGFRRKGLQFDDIVIEMEKLYGATAPSKAVLHRWASRESSCTCPWHDWTTLLENDNDLSHSRAVSIYSIGHDIVVIANTLNMPVEVIEAWGREDYPCYCGSHGWLVSNAVDVVPPKENMQIIPVSYDIKEANQTAILTILDAAANAVRKGDVAPRSWKDILDTLKMVDLILNPAPSYDRTSTRSPGGMKLTESRSLTIPPPESGSVYMKERSKQLASELMSAVGIHTENAEE